MRKITVDISEGHVRLLDKLVAQKIYPNRNEAIREGIRDLLKAHGKL